MRLRVVTSATGAPELELDVPARVEDDGANGPYPVALERLGRAEVEELRDALDAFLAGRPLPR